MTVGLKIHMFYITIQIFFLSGAVLNIYGAKYKQELTLTTMSNLARESGVSQVLTLLWTCKNSIKTVRS